jgi:hypothetical protein
LGRGEHLKHRPDGRCVEAWQDGPVPRQRDVEQWFARYDNPMKEVVMRVREIVLGADARIDECIKWQAPTFLFEGNLASFFPKSKQHASLMFHQGAKIPGRFPRLEGSGELGRVMKIGTVAEADAARAELEAIVRAWCEWRTSGTAATTSATANKSTTAKKAAATNPARKPAARKPAAKARPTAKARPAAKAHPTAKARPAAKRARGAAGPARTGRSKKRR